MSRSPGGLLACELSEAVERTLRSEADKAAPEEACGLLVGRIESGRARIGRAVPCENEAPAATRGERFMIDPRRLIREERALRGSGMEVVGFYHSHPKSAPVPSEIDRPFMGLWPEVVWLIVGTGADPARRTLRAWTSDGDRPEVLREIALERTSSG